MSNQDFDRRRSYHYVNNISASSSCNSESFTIGSNTSEFIKLCRNNNLKIVNTRVCNRQNSNLSNSQRQVSSLSKKSANVLPMHGLLSKSTHQYENHHRRKSKDRSQTNLANYDLKNQKYLQKNKTLTTSESLSSCSSTATTIAPTENNYENHSQEGKKKKHPIISSSKNSILMTPNIMNEQRRKDLLQGKEINIINRRKFVSELNLPNYLEQGIKDSNEYKNAQKYYSNRNQSTNNLKTISDNLEITQSQFLNSLLNGRNQQTIPLKNTTKRFSTGILSSPRLNFQKKKFSASQQKIFSKFVISLTFFRILEENFLYIYF